MVKVKRYVRRRQQIESPVFRAEGTIIRGLGWELGGVSSKEIVMLKQARDQAQRKRALFKLGRAAQRESIASTIDDLLGWDLVPKTTMREFDSTVGSTQEWIPRARMPLKEELELLKHRRDVFKIAALDFIIGNADRHRGNILIKGERLYAIDNAFSLEDPERLFYPGNLTTIQIVKDKEIPEDIWNDLRNVEEGDLRTALAPIALEPGGKEILESAVWRWMYLVRTRRIPDPWNEEFRKAAAKKRGFPARFAFD